MRKIPHNLVATRLAEIRGVGVRNGCFCAHLLIKELVGVGLVRDIMANLGVILMPRLTGAILPGLVRISFGIENKDEEVDDFISTMKQIAAEKTSFVNKSIARTYNGTLFIPKTDEKDEMQRLVNSLIDRVYFSFSASKKEENRQQKLSLAISETGQVNRKDGIYPSETKSRTFNLELLQFIEHRDIKKNL
jgi:hypothetical protein